MRLRELLRNILYPMENDIMEVERCPECDLILIDNKCPGCPYKKPIKAKRKYP